MHPTDNQLHYLLLEFHHGTAKQHSIIKRLVGPCKAKAHPLIDKLTHMSGEIMPVLEQLKSGLIFSPKYGSRTLRFLPLNVTDVVKPNFRCMFIPFCVGGLPSHLREGHHSIRRYINTLETLHKVASYATPSAASTNNMHLSWMTAVWTQPRPHTTDGLRVRGNERHS